MHHCGDRDPEILGVPVNFSLMPVAGSLFPGLYLEQPVAFDTILFEQIQHPRKITDFVAPVADRYLDIKIAIDPTLWSNHHKTSFSISDINNL
jgi:hypothetical protein